MTDSSLDWLPPVNNTEMLSVTFPYIPLESFMQIISSVFHSSVLVLVLVVITNLHSSIITAGINGVEAFIHFFIEVRGLLRELITKHRVRYSCLNASWSEQSI